MEPKFAFINDLNKPVHRSVIKSCAARPARNEVMIDKSWCIKLDKAAPVQVLTAAQDLRDFLRTSFGLKLSISADGPRAIYISAGNNKSVPPSAGDEGFVLNVKKTGISIRGSGPRGALYGTLYLEDRFVGRGAPCAGVGTVRRRPRFAPRVLRHYSSPYYTEAIDGVRHYTDNYLARLAHLGYDAVWMRGELRSLSNTTIFPELGQDAARNLAALNDLIKRAGRWGIGVYLYLCEPLGLPTDHPFWKRYPHIRGAEGGEMGKPIKLNAMCTSTSEVKQFLYESSRDLFTRAPRLEGLILITASEHTAHCKQRKVSPKPCPRCAGRDSAEIIAEVITLIHKGTRAAGSNARIVAWNWAWENHVGPKADAEIFKHIPPDIAWMANVENGGPIKRFGMKTKIWEYSLCYPGPSPEFRRKGRQARATGHRQLWGKVQINVTHEMASMPYMPVPYLLRDKFAGLARMGVEGIMCCWIFGSFPGIGSRQANAMMWEPFGDTRRALLECAAAIYGDRAAPLVVRAWNFFSRGYAMYPFDGVYIHVLNDAPAHPFFFPPVRRPERANWQQALGTFGDILRWCHRFSPEVHVKSYAYILRYWERGMAILRKALSLVPKHLRAQVKADMRVCEAIGIHFRSSLNFVRFIRLRDRLPGFSALPWPEGYQPVYPLQPVKTEGQARTILAAIRTILREEKALVKSYLPLVEHDSRLGYHSEGGYRFRPKDLHAKLRQLKRVLEVEIPGYEKKFLS